MTEAAAAQDIFTAMIGTAGHVDHGKTSLVRQLTGFETDRHPEERERQMSIDFAVAPLTLSDGSIVGIIDVPGHEDFIRNMVAGASAVDLLLLVVAADDGVMPQTEEHLRIARLLGVSAVIAVLTKIDLVAPERLETAEAELRSFLAKSGYPQSPMVSVSNTTLEGIQKLSKEIEAHLHRLPARNDRRAFRMPIRQVFSAKGHGLIVTGVPLSGAIGIGEPAEILPLGASATVRGIENYRTPRSTARAFRSTALNLRTTAESEQISRGMVLAEPGIFTSCEQLIAWFENRSAGEPLRSRKPLLFHSGTVSCEAIPRLVDCNEAPPGHEAFVRLRFDRPVCVAAGDRFVLRNSSGHFTYGGGVILSVHVPRSRRLSEALFDRLIRARDAVSTGGFFLSELLAGGKSILTESELFRRAQCSPVEFERERDKLLDSGELTALGAGGYLVHAREDELRFNMKRALTRYHQQNGFSWGMTPAAVCELLGLPPGGFEALAPILMKSDALTMKYGRLALAEFEPKIGGREIRLREELLKLLQRSGIQGIARGNLLEQLQMKEPECRAVLKSLTDEQQVAVIGGHIFSRDEIERARQVVTALAEESPTFDLAQFRDRTGASRNVATLILDSFDASGFTRRVEGGRVLTRKK